jgi:hypothetical protein
VDIVDSVDNSPLTENPEVAEKGIKPLTENPEMAFQDVENQDTEKPEHTNNKTLNKEKLNNEVVKKEVPLPDLIEYIEGSIERNLSFEERTYIKDYWLSKISTGAFMWAITRKPFKTFEEMETSLIEGYTIYKLNN